MDFQPNVKSQPKYNVLELIGEGMFGKVYKGINCLTNELVAIKMEEHSSLLKNESNIYLLLNEESGFPKLRWYGKIGQQYWMVIDLLGTNLREFKNEHIDIGWNIIKYIGLQMFTLIKILHKYHLLHRDIKPENFVFGEKSSLHLIDFGMAKTYFMETHVPNRKIDELIGSNDFVSVNVHYRSLPSRRDDLESILYILFYLYLPGWVNGKEEETILFKERLTTDQPELATCLRYIRQLKYEETPDYEYLIQLFILT